MEQRSLLKVIQRRRLLWRCHMWRQKEIPQRSPNRCLQGEANEHSTWLGSSMKRKATTDTSERFDPSFYFNGQTWPGTCLLTTQTTWSQTNEDTLTEGWGSNSLKATYGLPAPSVRFSDWIKMLQDKSFYFPRKKKVPTLGLKVQVLCRNLRCPPRNLTWNK